MFGREFDCEDEKYGDVEREDAVALGIDIAVINVLSKRRILHSLLFIFICSFAPIWPDFFGRFVRSLQRSRPKAQVPCSMYKYGFTCKGLGQKYPNVTLAGFKHPANDYAPADLT